MAATTTLLGLVTPTQGSLPGVWGDTVNYGITEYLDIAIAGTLTLTGDGTVILANTTGSSSGTNITSTLSGAGTVTAQFAIVKVSGTTGVKIVQAPSFSRTYLVVNASSFAVTFKPSAASGVSIAAGETASVYYNGTDYVKVVGTATAGAAGGSTTQVQYNNAGVLAGITGATTDGTALTLVAPVLGTPASATLTLATGLPISTGVSGLGTNVATALGVNTGSAGAFVVNGGALGSPSSVGTMPAFTLGGTVSGGGNQINNVIIGTTTPLAGAFTTLSSSGQISSTNNDAFLAATPSSGSAAGYIRVINTGGTYFIGANNSTGSSLTGTAYSLNLTAPSGKVIENAITDTGVITKVSSTGLAVTGTLSATGTLSGGTSGTAYSFSGSAPATSLTLDSSGNLGVGTTSPARKLHVDGGGSATYIQLSNTASGSTNADGFQLTQDGANCGLINREAGYMSFDTSNTERARIDSSGNLGVGTSSTTGARLSVVKTGDNSRIAMGDTAAASYSTLLMYGGSGKYNFQLGVQANVNNAFEITPSTATEGTTFSTPALVVYSNGTVSHRSTVSVGDATPSSSGAGITFPATQSASSNANTFDDYEEGTYTVTLIPLTSGTITLKTGFAKFAYTKTGRSVTVTGRVDVASVSLPIGTLLEFNIPFPIADLADKSGAFASSASATVAGVAVALRYISGLATGTIAYFVVDCSTVIADDTFRLSFTYFTD